MPRPALAALALTLLLAAVPWSVAAQATPSASPATGPNGFLADTTGGLAAWPLPDPEDDQSWAVSDGLLANDGSGAGTVLSAPYWPCVADYAVEAEIRVTGFYGGTIFYGFGIAARVGAETGGDREGYWGGVGFLQGPQAFVSRVDPINSSFEPFIPALNDAIRGVYGPGAIAAFDPAPFGEAPRWYTYRLEVEGERIRLLIDGQAVAEAQDARYRAPGRAGLWSNGVRLEIRRFAVILSPAAPGCPADATPST